YGCKTKVERGNRVFPVSDHSSDVIAALQRAFKESHVEIRLQTKVSKLLAAPLSDEEQDDGGKKLARKKVVGVLLENGEKIFADAVIVATGGFSYQATGSTGDGYRFAKEVGHFVTELVPSLVPFYAKESYVREMQGLSLKNIRVRIYLKKKLLYDEFGEMLFTHFGVSGPLILSAGAVIKPTLAEKNLMEQKRKLGEKELFLKEELSMEIDLKPALSAEQLDARLVREFEEGKNKQFKNLLGNLFPTKMIPVMLRLSNIPPEKKANQITKAERADFVRLIKAFPLTLTGMRDFNEAIITRGGVTVKEVNPSTMESKLVRSLYFCGELLDLDAVTGGFNLQIAWSTGFLAGSSVGKERKETS
ncbi:MAG: aminoacetone oxidase family FAD-binding enzyme, partial [Clostridiales bacterium]|nr:aminoacetone oxidase family FAD-binding enzyme [Clostridiales bacterium]